MIPETKVEVNEGICTGRNGTFDISGVQVFFFTYYVRLDCISKTRKTVLNAGFSIDNHSARTLAETILNRLKEEGPL